jgi:hypothetical protein
MLYYFYVNYGTSKDNNYIISSSSASSTRVLWSGAPGISPLAIVDSEPLLELGTVVEAGADELLVLGAVLDEEAEEAGAAVLMLASSARMASRMDEP